MSEVDPKLGELIKKTRIERKLTQEEVAEMVNCHTQYYKNLENGHGMPSVNMLCRIFRALHLSSDLYVWPELNKDNPVYRSLLSLLSLCDEYKLSVLLATAEALLADAPGKDNNKK